MPTRQFHSNCTQQRRSTSFSRLLSALTILLIFSTLPGCALLEKLGIGNQGVKPQFKPVPEEITPPAGIYDVDEYTGVSYFISEELVQTFNLPDGSQTEMVLLPGGEYIIGLNDEDPLGIQPSGNVRMSVNAFWMDRTEVTNSQYWAFLKSLDRVERQEMMPDSLAWTREVGVPWSVYFRDEAYAHYPVTCVNWHQAKAYAKWAGKQLPSEVEWEYAARSGISGRIYPWDGINAQHPRTGEYMANFAPGNDFAADGYVLPAAVGTFLPNNFRLYDMAGNVAEWCEDAYFPSYKILKANLSSLVTPRYRNENEPRKIVRGGSWASGEFFIGVGVRSYRISKQASPRVGFRCVKRVKNPEMQARAKLAYKQQNIGMTNQQLVRSESSVISEPAEPQPDAQAPTDSTAATQPEQQQSEKNFFQKMIEAIKKPFQKLFN